MRRLMQRTILAAACLLPLHAMACSMPERLAARYGVTFSGFATPLPASADPDTRSGGPWLRMRLPDKANDKANVLDGFRHTALVDVKAKKAWILRTGGFVGVYQWYGPVDVRDIPLDACPVEAGHTAGPAPRKPGGAA